MSKKPTAKTKLKKYYIAHKGLVLILAFILIGLGIGKGVEYYQQRQLENKFSYLDKDLGMLDARLQQTTKNTEIIKNRYCYRDTFKHNKGSLKCAISLNAKDVPYASIKKFISAIENDYRSWDNQKWTTLDHANLDVFPYHKGKYKNLNSGKTCMAALSNSKDSTKNKDRLDFELSCSEKSHRAFYPYRD